MSYIEPARVPPLAATRADLHRMKKRAGPPERGLLRAEAATLAALREYNDGDHKLGSALYVLEVEIIETLRVSGSSRPNAVAGAIAALLRTAGQVEVQAIGPHAVNQAVKAIAIARSYIEGDDLDLRAVPSFVKLELQDEERTAVRFLVQSHQLEGDEDATDEDFAASGGDEAETHTDYE